MSFARILRSSSMLAAAQVVTLASAFVRSKIIAVTMGPSGVGLVGVMSAFNGNVTALAAWGLGTSGVRLVAGSNGEEQKRKEAAVRRFGLLVSAAGILLTVTLFWPVTLVTFQEASHAPELLIAGMAVPCIIATTTWSSLLQARGLVKSLATLQVVTALIGVVAGAPLIFLFGALGIAVSILLAAAIPAIATWAIARRHCPPSTVAADRNDLMALLRMGGGLVVVGLAAQIAAYAVRLLIIRHVDGQGLDGLAAAGYYQAAIAVAGSLPAVVFGAMGTDFFPRVAAAKDEAEARFLSEKQIQAGLLLALPLLTALLTMGAVGLRFLYDARFEGAEPMLAWMIWGVFLRLLAWPLGYWMLAKGSVRLVVIVEVACSIVMVILPAILIPLVGEVGAASSYLISYAIYSLVMLVVSKLRSGEWISAEVFAWFAIAALWLLFAQAGYNYLHGMWWGVSVTAISLLACSLVYYRTLRGELVKPIEPLNLP